MHKLIAILLAILVAVSLYFTCVNWVTAEDIYPQMEINHPDTPEEFMDYYAKRYHLSNLKLTQFKKTRICESNGNPAAHNKSDPNGGSVSEMQFQKPTFYAYAKKAGIKNPDIKDRKHVLHTGIYMFSIGEAGQWTTYRALINGGSYTFYSSHEGRWITIYCS